MRLNEIMIVPASVVTHCVKQSRPGSTLVNLRHRLGPHCWYHLLRRVHVSSKVIGRIVSTDAIDLPPTTAIDCILQCLDRLDLI